MALKADLEHVVEKIRFVPRGSETVIEGDLTTSHSKCHGKSVLVEQVSGTYYAPDEVAGVAASGPEQETRLRDAGYTVVDGGQLEALCAHHHSA